MIPFKSGLCLKDLPTSFDTLQWHFQEKCTPSACPKKSYKWLCSKYEEVTLKICRNVVCTKKHLKQKQRIDCVMKSHDRLEVSHYEGPVQALQLDQTSYCQYCFYFILISYSILNNFCHVSQNYLLLIRFFLSSYLWATIRG